MLEEDKDVTSQQPPSTNTDLMVVMTRQLEQLDKRFDRMDERFDRMDGRSRDLATRSDLEALRKELVARDSFEVLMNGLRTQTTRVDTDRIADKVALENRIDRLEQEQVTRQDRLWIRLGQIMSVAAFALALLELVSHLRFLP